MNKNQCGEVLALIPARGGSKSVPRKNIVKLLGKPMIVWAIEHALASKHICRVIVSTDDEEIAYIARQNGAEVPFLRPAEISRDFSLDVEFHRHALEWLQAEEKYEPDMVVNLRPTPPSRSSMVIDSAIETFFSHAEADSLRSVHLATESPFKMWFINDEGYMNPVAHQPNLHEAYNQPRQKLPLIYWQDGYVDITRPRIIFEKNSTTGDIIFPFLIEEPAVDIDYPDALASAEAQLRLRTNVVSRSANELKPERFPS